MPGLQALARDATNTVQARSVADGVEVALHNFHFLRQSFELMSGSSFSYHADFKDVSLAPLEYSLSVKLTEDPAAASGSWMQMAGGEPMPYGKAAGSAMLFHSAAVHRSLECAPDMGDVLKVGFFFGKVCLPS